MTPRIKKPEGDPTGGETARAGGGEGASDECRDIYDGDKLVALVTTGFTGTVLETEVLLVAGLVNGCRASFAAEGGKSDIEEKTVDN